MKIVVLTGAGISAESGIETFRDIKNGLWYNYNIDEVATSEALEKNPALVLEFHNMLRNKSREIEPNEAHLALQKLESEHEVTIITQNVDNLHEKAGSTNVLHIHGELFKKRTSDGRILECDEDILIGDLDDLDEQFRPHTVLFGEMPFHWDESFQALTEADMLIVVGTSFSITYIGPMVGSVREDCEVFYVDPKPDLTINYLGLNHLTVLSDKATKGVSDIVSSILN